MCIGLARVFWRYLVDPVLQLKENCNVDGDIIGKRSHHPSKTMHDL
jgi:hypothetical protein